MLGDVTETYTSTDFVSSETTLSETVDVQTDAVVDNPTRVAAHEHGAHPGTLATRTQHLTPTATHAGADAGDPDPSRSVHEHASAAEPPAQLNQRQKARWRRKHGVGKFHSKAQHATSAAHRHHASDAHMPTEPPSVLVLATVQKTRHFNQLFLRGDSVVTVSVRPSR